VGGIELLEVVPFLAKMLQVFARFVELENVIAGIAVGQKNIPVGSDGDFGRVEVLRVNAELFGAGRLIDQEKGEFSIFITDDARHIPVGGRVKTDYGTFDITLKRIVNLDQDSPQKATNNNTN